MGMEGSMGPPGGQNNLGPANSEGSMYSPSRYPSQQRLVLSNMDPFSLLGYFLIGNTFLQHFLFLYFADTTATGSSIPACHMECIHLGCIHSNRCKKKIPVTSACSYLDCLIHSFSNPTVSSQSKLTHVEDKFIQG